MPRTSLKQKQSNWTQSVSTAVDFIQNKPTIPVVSTAISGVSKIGNDIVLGNNMGGVSAVLTSNREIPTNGFSLNLSGSGKIGVQRNASQPAQGTIHVGNGNTSGLVGNYSYILSPNISNSQNIGDNTILNGTVALTCTADNSAILSGVNISITEAANNSSTLTTVSGTNLLTVLNARGSTSVGVNTSLANTPLVYSTINNKYFSGLYSTTNAWIQGSVAPAFNNNGDNNAIIGGNNNLIGGNLNITGTPGSYNAVPELLGTVALNYADDSVILGSEYSQITDTGNSVIISGSRGTIRGSVRSTMISSDSSTMLATTRNTSGGQMFSASVVNATLTNINYSSSISTSGAIMNGTTGGAKDRSVTIAGTGLKSSASDQLTQGTFNEGLSESSVEFGIGVSDANRKNALSISKSGATIIANLPNANAPVPTKGGIYYNTTDNEYKKCDDGSTWTSFSVAPVLPISISRIATLATSFNALATGNTLIYTVPAGKYLFITNIVFRTDTTTATTAAPSVSVGFTPTTYDNVMPNTVLTGAFTGGKSFTYNVSGASNVAPPSTVVTIKVNTAGAGTALTYGVDLFGYLL